MNDKNGLESLNDCKRGYTVCWVHTNTGDHYVGRVSANNFSGKILTVTLSPMAKIGKAGDDKTWHAIGDQFDSYRLSFDIKKVEERQGDKWIKLRSVIGEVIILSEHDKDIEEIDCLLNRTPAVPA